IARMRSASVASNGMWVVPSDDFHSLWRIRFAGVLVEPDFVPHRVEDLERAIAPPLHGERVSDSHFLLFHFVMVTIDVRHLEVDLDGLLRRDRLFLRSR